MINLKGFEPRDYQSSIFKTTKDHNTLVVLPTGMGKTGIALLLAINRLNNFPESKILILAPSRPLVNQHFKTFSKHLDIDKEKIQAITGLIQPAEREKLWEEKQIIFSTPQCIQNDIKKRINLKEVSLIVVDECHRSVKEYSYVPVIKKYQEQGKNQRILALTASPGGTRKKIKEICANLNINKVEIRTETDEDVKEYIQDREIEWIDVELNKELKQISKLIKILYKEKINKAKNYGIGKPASIINKKDLLMLQQRLQIQIRRGNKMAYSGVSIVAQALKLSHMIEMLETQSLGSLKNFLQKLETDTTKAANIILNNIHIKNAIKLTDQAIANKIEHPKMKLLKEIAKNELIKNPNSKLIIFANFRDTVKEIVKKLNEIKNVRAIELMGQKEGVTQKIQIQTIKNFEENIYNVLVGTSISEEGLDISGCDKAIFYDNVASSIRRIQRAGRVARINPGKIIYLITKDTKDAAYYWKSKNEEKKMKNILYGMKGKTLGDYDENNS